MFDKIIRSSEDPKKVSLAVRGFILLVGAQVVAAVDFACSIGATCLGIDNALVVKIAEAFELIVYAAMLLVGAVWTLYGIVRKLHLGRWSAVE